VRTLPTKEAAKRTDRTLAAVWTRRQQHCDAALEAVVADGDVVVGVVTEDEQGAVIEQVVAARAAAMLQDLQARAKHLASGLTPGDARPTGESGNSRTHRIGNRE